MREETARTQKGTPANASAGVYGIAPSLVRLEASECGSGRQALEDVARMPYVAETGALVEHGYIGFKKAFGTIRVAYRPFSGPGFGLPMASLPNAFAFAALNRHAMPPCI